MSEQNRQEVSAWTPTTSMRGVGERPLGPNQVDEIAEILSGRNPQFKDKIDEVVNAMDNGEIGAPDAAILLQGIEAEIN